MKVNKGNLIKKWSQEALKGKVSSLYHSDHKEEEAYFTRPIGGRISSCPARSPANEKLPQSHNKKLSLPRTPGSSSSLLPSFPHKSKPLSSTYGHHSLLVLSCNFLLFLNKLILLVKELALVFLKVNLCFACWLDLLSEKLLLTYREARNMNALKSYKHRTGQNMLHRLEVRLMIEAQPWDQEILFYPQPTQ